MLRLSSRRVSTLLQVSKPLRHGPSIAPRTVQAVFGQQQRTYFDFLKAKPADDKEKPVVPALNVAVQEESSAPATEVPLVDASKRMDIEYSIGKYAKLADGSVMARWGDSMVLATAVSEKTVDATGSDFLPLMVDYREKYASTGTIPGSAKRREMSGTDEEVLKSRIVDRIVRPLFPKGYNFETQLVATVQSYDVDHDPVVLAVNSTSAALTTSNIPWNGPIGCVRVAKIDDRFVVNPTAKDMKSSTMDLLYAATAHRTLMIEADGAEIDEATFQAALRLAHEHVQPIIAAQLELPRKEKRSFEAMAVPEAMATLGQEILADVRALLGSLALPNGKKDRQALEGKCYNMVKGKFVDLFPEYTKDSPVVNLAAHDLIQEALRANALAGVRLDGRADNVVRDLSMETTLLPMAHGSALFNRGDTQALCTVTLGRLDEALRVRNALNDHDNYISKHAMLHYEFPPYCVNETGKLGGPNRRMLGHGALAEKAILPLLPPIKDFPHTIRMTSETMGSDGSSSMATVCGVSLALLDAGVPLKAPVAGVSVGLVSGGDLYDGITPIKEYRLLTDILGTEDHYGDMDFKIAGTSNGITAIQLDVKLPGVPVEILCEGLEHAKRGRETILAEMKKTRAKPRAIDSNKVAGSVIVNIDPSMRGALIGAGGANIREIELESKCGIHCKEDGLVEIVSNNEDDIAVAKRLIEQSTFIYRRNQRYSVVVLNIMDFGCMVVPAFAYGTPLAQEKAKQAFLHVSEMAHTPVKRASAVVQVGQKLDCWCIFAEREATKLSLKALVDPKTNKPLSDDVAASLFFAREEAQKRARSN
ncbi:Aste57867_20339 [Aphanomyces stellatus]|uniref:polyribonucleotide nucleotidyltransferase n=1 Tax=Aphanomyces stellatus TaxID=120398 RepID=A0A485LGQ5_9STRA|nr:hypothetical protein As57867_020273 [Aphanomyces stellatus]VFT97026.1 Aste57867_20339 [Aphanomyces stellatus]